MFSGHAGGVIPRHELIEGGGAVAGGETGERVGQPDLRVDAAHLAGLDHAGDDGPVIAAIVGTGEQPCPSAQGHRPFILPMSGTNWKFTIGGIPISAAGFGCCGSSSARWGGITMLR